MVNLYDGLNEEDQKKLLSVRDKLAKDTEAQSILNALVNNFMQQPHRESFSNFLSTLEFSEGRGLLTAIEEELEKRGGKIKFDHIKKEELSLKSLLEGEGTFSVQAISDDLQNCWEIGKEIEKYLCKIFLNKMNILLPTKLNEELKSRIRKKDDLIHICGEIKYFLNEYEKEIGNIKIENISVNNQAIIDFLKKEGKIDEKKINNLSDPELKKAMDVLVSREMTSGLQKYGETLMETEKNISESIGNTFPILGSVTKKFPYKPRELREENEGLDNTLKDLEKSLIKAKGFEEKKMIEQQIEEAYRQAYRRKIEESDEDLAQVLQILWENNFDYSKLTEEQLQIFFNLTLEQRTEVAIENGLAEYLIGGQENLKQFLKDLLDPTKKEINIAGMTIPVNKKLKSGANPKYKKLENREKDNFPFEFEIDIDGIWGEFSENNKKVIIEMIKQNGIGNEEGEVIQNWKATLEGEKIGKFISLLLGAYGMEKIETTQHEKQLKETIPTSKNNENDETQKNEFYEAWEKVEGYKFSKDGKEKYPWLRRGTKLMLALGGSGLPPFEVGAQDWAELNIEEVNEEEGRFEVRFKGSALSLPTLEGNKKKFPLNPESLARLKKIGTLLKLPDPKDSNNPGDHLKKLKEVGFLWKGLSAFDALKRDDGKRGWLNEFANEEGGKGEKEVVQYFWYQDLSYDGGKPSKQNIIYKVEYSPGKKTFKVECSGFMDGKEKGDKKYKKRSKELDYNNFLLFIADKKLKAQKKSEAEEAQERNDEKAKTIYNKKNRNRFRASFGTIKNVFKGERKKISDKFSAYQKDQEERFNDRLIDDAGLYNIVSKTLGWIPSVRDSIGGLQMERFNEKDNNIRKKIEYWKKIIEADPRFADMFEESPDFVHTLFGGKSYRQFLTENDEGFEPPELYRAAALLLVNIKAGKSPYRTLSEYENSGLWVKKLLGKEHYDNFIKQKQQLLTKLNDEPDNEDQLIDLLSKCEMLYITNTINGIPWGQQRSFGSIESRGKYPDGKPGYIDNPSKNRLSGKFAGELQDARSSWNNKNAIEEAYGKINHDNFDVAKNDFDKIKSGRFVVAMANLKKMGTLAETDGQKKVFKQCMISVLVSGALNTYGDKATHKRFYTMAKSFNFAPGFLAKNFKHPEYTKALLNEITKGNFEREINQILEEDDDIKKLKKEGKISSPYTLDNFNPTSKNTQIGILNKAIGKWWNQGTNYEDFEKFCSPGGELATQDRSKEGKDNKTIEKFQKKLFDSSMEETDKDILDNDNLANDVGLLASKSIVEKRMKYQYGEFSYPDDPNKVEAARGFWNKVNTDLKSSNVETAMTQYLNRFPNIDKELLVKLLKTAHRYKTEIKKQWWPVAIELPTFKKKRKDGTTENLKFKSWEVNNDDWKQASWYAIKGQVLANGNGLPPPELDNVLESFYEKFLENLDKIVKDDFISETFKGADYTSVEAGLLVNNKEYDLVQMAGKSNIFGEFGEEDHDEEDDTRPENMGKEERSYKKQLYRSSEFVNASMIDIERQLKRHRALPDKHRLTGSTWISKDPQFVSSNKNRIKLHNNSSQQEYRATG